MDSQRMDCVRPLRTLPPVLVACAALLLSPIAARAHGIQSNLELIDAISASLNGRDGGRQPAARRLQLDSSFSTGEPVAAAAVSLVAPDGSTAIDLGRTDGKGRLTFALPKQASADWELQVDGGPGHRDYLELPASSGAAAGQAAATRSAPDRPLALARELRQAGGRLPLKGLSGAGAIGAIGFGGLGLGFGARSLARRRR